MALVTVTVTVPEENVADLLRHAAALIEGDADERIQWTDPEVNGGGGTRWGFGRAAVRKAYQGGTSDYWRPFLEYLASRPDEWVTSEEAAEAVGLDISQLPGMLGAAERRCRQRPPYEKQWDASGHREFLMPERVAVTVQEVAAE